ncbi:MAG: 2-C-methyl-D-erythritol 4-phosphate cytidylyltransferase [Phycisphaeraceae bacterium]|nr:2-C-methyl-D-erythritol 4-phosphate cytidylyltransferase [Phycisphaeraceae bacterium]
MSISLIIPAAGLGRRFAGSGQNTSKPKIEQDLCGKPVFIRTIEQFRKHAEVTRIILAVPPDGMAEFKLRYGDMLGFQGVKVVAGGTRERWETVLLALEAIEDQAEFVAIHDAVRPMVSAALIERTFEAARRYGAAVPAIAITNTIKRAIPCEPPKAADMEDDPAAAILGVPESDRIDLKQVIETLDRRELVEIQTPQVFAAKPLRDAYRQLAEGRIDPETITDDAMLLEATGQPVYLVEGDPLNLKITRPEDLELARAWYGVQGKAREAQAARMRLFVDEDD